MAPRCVERLAAESTVTVATGAGLKHGADHAAEPPRRRMVKPGSRTVEPGSSGAFPIVEPGISSQRRCRSEEGEMRSTRQAGERRRPVLRFDLAPGVHGVEHAHTNCYVVDEPDGVTLVDACFPSTGAAVVELLATLGRRPADIRALILTHGHFDHVGFARVLKVSLGTPIWVHGADRTLAAHPYRYRPERNRVVFTLGHGRSLPILGGMVLAGALAVRGVEADELFGDGDVLEVPGRPRVIHTPGHTAGQ